MYDNFKNIMYGNKKKKKPEKKMKGKECSTCGETQHNVPKRVEEHKKIKPKEVFDYSKKKISKNVK
jgi:Zn ribbon nucleic-acid-binding protein